MSDTTQLAPALQYEMLAAQYWAIREERDALKVTLKDIKRQLAEIEEEYRDTI